MMLHICLEEISRQTVMREVRELSPKRTVVGCVTPWPLWWTRDSLDHRRLQQRFKKKQLFHPPHMKIPGGCHRDVFGHQ